MSAQRHTHHHGVMRPDLPSLASQQKDPPKQGLNITLRFDSFPPNIGDTGGSEVRPSFTQG
jgi:hypothetical protein